jgi:hypothetical protein
MECGVLTHIFAMTVVPGAAPPDAVALDFSSVTEVEETVMPHVGNAVVAYVT